MSNHKKKARKNSGRKPRAHTGKRKPNFNSALMLLRQRLHMTLAELSEATGIQATVLSNIENGKTAMIGTFETLAEFFHVSLDALVRNDITATLASLPPEEVVADPESNGVLDVIRKHRESTGKKGENIVVALERAALVGTPYASAVTDAPAHSSGAHFDVLSYTPEGACRYIEVKTTPYGWDEDFFLSASELEFLLDCKKTGKLYELHRVYGIKDPTKAGRIVYTADDVLKLFVKTPSSYRLHVVKEEENHDRTAV